jgi:CRP-like cAMP-binding protein
VNKKILAYLLEDHHGLGRQQLADLVGASMFTVSRLLAGWQREGLVVLGRERVVLRDPQALAQRAG